MFRTVILPLIIAFLPFAFSYVLPRAEALFPYPNDRTTICVRPAPWNQILSFFITNYAARVLTFKKTSGYNGYRDYLQTFQSLFVPFKGISEAAMTIARGSRFLGKDDLDRALLAKALCVVVRNRTWRPEDGEIIRGCIVTEVESRDKRRRRRKSRRRSESKHRRRSRRRERSRDLGERSREDSVGHIHRDEQDEKPHRRGRHHRHDYKQVPLNPDYPHEEDSDVALESDYDSDAEITASATLVVAPFETTRYIQYIDPKEYKIHGSYTLPDSYELALLRPGAAIQPLSTSTAQKSDVTISNSYGIAKSFAGAIQIISSLYALYSAYGLQSNRFGYAAYGFSVLPYTVMSLLNAVANLIESSYDTLYLVRSDVMLECEKRERGEIVGEIAELIPADRDLEQETLGPNNRSMDIMFRRHYTGTMIAYHVIPGTDQRASNKCWKVHIPNNPDTYDYVADRRTKISVLPFGQNYGWDRRIHKRSAKFRKRAVFVITLFALLTPYVVIGAISKFKAGESSVIERTFMMGWLVVGQVIGALNLMSQKGEVRGWKWWRVVETVVRRLVVLVGFAFAIGGFVFTARNLRDFGYCVKLTGL